MQYQSRTYFSNIFQVLNFEDNLWSLQLFLSPSHKKMLENGIYTCLSLGVNHMNHILLFSNRGVKLHQEVRCMAVLFQVWDGNPVWGQRSGTTILSTLKLHSWVETEQHLYQPLQADSPVPQSPASRAIGFHQPRMGCSAQQDPSKPAITASCGPSRKLQRVHLIAPWIFFPKWPRACGQFITLTMVCFEQFYGRLSVKSLCH